MKCDREVKNERHLFILPAGWQLHTLGQPSLLKPLAAV